MAKFRPPVHRPADAVSGRSQGVPFWRAKRLEAMTAEEWESLCDGCARCCLMKLEDIDTGEIAWTDVACTLLETDSCRCRDYPGRHDIVPDCISLDPKTVRTLSWLPPTCAYRLVAEGRDLDWWHPLVSGSAETVHRAGISVRGRVVREDEVDIDDLEDHVVDWPEEGGA
ncbi:MAG TPA: YcgN family cysteine cluster protein [Kaistiaceae bacterium]|nr:YcgN family cysteine cluster protein [Kaistiaceae bacterium]